MIDKQKIKASQLYKLLNTAVERADECYLRYLELLDQGAANTLSSKALKEYYKVSEKYTILVELLIDSGIEYTRPQKPKD